jgi:hypothetical protein
MPANTRVTSVVKRIFLSLVMLRAVLGAQTAPSAETFADRTAKNYYHLEIKDGRFTGNGAAILESALADARNSCCWAKITESRRFRSLMPLFAPWPVRKDFTISRSKSVLRQRTNSANGLLPKMATASS